MNIAVTGGSGFVGQELIKALAAMHHNVINIDMVPSGSHVDEIVHDLTTSPVEIEADFCFHLASAAGGLLFNQKQDVILYNSKLNENVLKSCHDMPILFVSTLNIFEGCKTINDETSPETSYANSKLDGERYFLSEATDLYIVRPSNIFGASQLSKFIAYGESHVIPDMLNKIDVAEVLEVWGDGNQQRNFLHVTDLCIYLMKFLDGDEDKIHNVCSSVTVSMTELAEDLLKFREKCMPIRYDSSYMKYEKMFINDILKDLENIGTVNSILEGLAL